MAPKHSETRITTMQLRAHLGEVLDRVRLRSMSVLIERKGRAVAALVPAGRMRRLEEFARTRARELLAIQDSAGFDDDVTDHAVEEAARAVKAVRRAKGRR
jgi:prevent-host-death family protein